MTIGHETYVNFETATLLEKAGFDWKCQRRFFNGVFDDEGPISPAQNFNGTDRLHDLSAPSLCVAQRWLREIKCVNVEVRVKYNRYDDADTYHGLDEAYCFFIIENPTFGPGVDFDDVNRYSESEYKNDEYGGFLTYEEALETGIKKALEILLEKGE